MKLAKPVAAVVVFFIASVPVLAQQAKPATAAPSASPVDVPALVDQQTRYDANQLITDALADTRKKAIPRHDQLKAYLDAKKLTATFESNRPSSPVPPITYEKAYQKAADQLKGSAGKVVPMTNDLQMLKGSADANEQLARRQLDETIGIVQDSAAMDAFINDQGKADDYTQWVDSQNTPEAIAAAEAAQRKELQQRQADQAKRKSEAGREKAANIAKYQQNIQAQQQAASYREQFYYKNASTSRQKQNYFDTW